MKRALLVTLQAALALELDPAQRRQLERWAAEAGAP